jgi:hypothetical protein
VQREWVIKSLVSYHKFAEEFEPFLRKEIITIRQKWEKINTPGIPEAIVAQLNELRNSFKELLISEEKNTRKLHDLVVHWAHRRKLRQLKIVKSLEEHGTEADQEAAITAMMNSSEERRLHSLRIHTLTGAAHHTGTASFQDSKAQDINEFEAPSDPQELLLQRASLFEFLEICKKEALVWDYEQRLVNLLEAKKQVLLEEQSRLRSMVLAQGLDASHYEKEIRIDDVVLQEADLEELGTEPPPAPWEQRLLPDELQLVLALNWIKTVNSQLPFRSTLFNLPTMEPLVYNRDELIQVRYSLTHLTLLTHLLTHSLTQSNLRGNRAVVL